MAGSAGEWLTGTMLKTVQWDQDITPRAYGSGYDFSSSYPLEYSTEGFNGSGAGWYYEENPFGSGYYVSGSEYTYRASFDYTATGDQGEGWYSNAEGTGTYYGMGLTYYSNGSAGKVLHLDENGVGRNWYVLWRQCSSKNWLITMMVKGTIH